jgi:hypothetical protein
MILFVKVPTAIALVSFIPVAPTLMLLAVEVVGLNEFGRIYKEKVRFRDYVKLVLGLVPYQVFLAAAAVRAVVRHAKGQNGWEKTEHTGQHRNAEQPAEVVGFASELTGSAGATSSSSSSERELAGTTTGGTR